MRHFTLQAGFSRVAVRLCVLPVLFASVLFWHSSATSVKAATSQVVSHTIKAHPLSQPTEQAPANPYKVLFKCQLPNAPFRCYSPQQIHRAYSYTPLYQEGITGKGQTIVIIDAFQDPTIRSDLQKFDATFGLPTPTFNIIAPQGLPPFDPNDPNQAGFALEIALDVEWAHAVAPGATIDLVLAKSNQDADMFGVTKYAVDHNLGSVISQSFGEAETCVDPTLLALEHQTFARATAKRITLLASSGDQGVAQPSCDGKTFIKSAGYPASDPYVMAVGGTELFATVNGVYRNEITWNETDLGLPYNIASGGGFSTIFSRPSYQNGVVNLDNRGVPDVAYNAGVNGGVLVVFGGSVLLVGGTSAGSPQWAGIVALAEQSEGERIGLLNRIVYHIGESSARVSTFHDIIAGNNAFFFLNKSLSFTGFAAQTDWDAATGWGTPIVSKLVPRL